MEGRFSAFTPNLHHASPHSRKFAFQRLAAGYRSATYSMLRLVWSVIGRSKSGASLSGLHTATIAIP